MKRTAFTSSPVIPITSAIGAGAIAMAAAALCPVLLPFALLSFFPLRRIAENGVARDVDRVTGDSAGRIARAWENARAPGERGIDVSTTLYSGGAFFDLPMTRTYRFEKDNEDE